MKNILITGLLFLMGSLIYLSSQNLPTNDVQIRKLKTTTGDIAIKNLSSQMKSLKKLVNNHPDKADHPQMKKFRSQWVDRIQTKMIYLGTVSELDQAKALVKESVNNKDQLLLNYSYYMMVHEFDRAHQEIEKLSQFASMKTSILGLRASHALAKGQNLEQAEKWMHELISARPTYSNYVRLAGVLKEQGKLREALNSFAQSILVYRNTSPFPPAYTHFQVAMIYGESMDEPFLAKKHYQMALKYLPQYVKARVHLSEILLTENNWQEALNTMEPVAESEDPEVASILSEIHLMANNKQKSEHYTRIATQRYKQLLGRYELAFSDHGAEFFMGPGNDPDLALKLALKNLENRKSKRAYELAQDALENSKSLNRGTPRS